MQLNPYLSFNGQCEAAFKFYERCLGGTIVAMANWSAAPEPTQLPPGWKDKIMHAQLAVGDFQLMGSDSPPPNYETPKGFSVTVGVDEAADADRIFRALSEGGTVRMPIQQTFFAVRFGMLTDRFGIPWMVTAGAGQA